MGYADKECNGVGCERQARGEHGFCAMHYKRWKRHGDPNHVSRIVTHNSLCSVEFCDGRYYGSGFCYKHWKRNRKYGDPLAAAFIPKKAHEKKVLLRDACALVEATRGGFVMIDRQDVEKVGQYAWHLTRHGGHAAARIDGKIVLMHRFLMNPPKGMQVDHINHNTLDNRRSNLRTCSGAENSKNTRSHAGSSSVFKGVWWNKEKGKWSCQIAIGNRKKHIGHFLTEEAAARAYDAKAKQLFGGFACLNFSQSVG